MVTRGDPCCQMDGPLDIRRESAPLGKGSCHLEVTEGMKTRISAYLASPSPPSGFA